jgi:undecaprenyl-diphosphatase
MFFVIFLSLLQGITEFLPISSSAHLMILPWLFKIPDPGLTFDVALHFGTLFAILLCFWKEWLEIFRATIYPNRQSPLGYNRLTLFYLLIATLPAVISGLLLGDKITSGLRHPLVTAGALVIFGGLLYFSDKLSLANKGIKNLKIKDAIFIGLFQALSLIPGVSRSGSTITAGLFRNYRKNEAAKISLLLATPVILGAAVLELKNIQNIFSWQLLIAIIISALSGYWVIKWFLKYINKIGYKIFCFYRIGLGLLIILIYFLRR